MSFLKFLLFLLFGVTMIISVKGHSTHVDYTKINTTIHEIQSIFISAYGDKYFDAGQSTACLICDFLIGEIIYQLESNISKNGVLPWLEKLVCDKLFPPTETGTSFNSRCTEILQLLIDEILKKIDKYDIPATLCKDLKICTSTKPRSEYKHNIDVLAGGKQYQ